MNHRLFVPCSPGLEDCVGGIRCRCDEESQRQLDLMKNLAVCKATLKETQKELFIRNKQLADTQAELEKLKQRIEALGI